MKATTANAKLDPTVCDQLLEDIKQIQSDYGESTAPSLIFSGADDAPEVYAIVPLDVERHFSPAGLSADAAELLSRISSAIEAFCRWDVAVPVAEWGVGFRWV